MELQKLVDNKLLNLTELPDEFISVVDSQNKVLFEALLKVLDSLETQDGVVLTNANNIAKAEQIVAILNDTLFGSDYLTAVQSFVGSFSEQAVLINEIYSEQFDFTEKDIYKSLVTQAQKSTLDFLDEDAIGQAVFEPLQKNLITSIYSGGKYSDMVKAMKEYLIDEPKLTSYVTRYARDSMAIFDNTYTQLIAKDVEVEYFEYSGGTLKDSREFCLQRVGNVYTKDEIEKWASKEWQGKNPATTEATIFAYRGGYNCIHSFIPRGNVIKEDVNKYN